MLLRPWLELLPVKLRWLSRYGHHVSRRARRPRRLQFAGEMLEQRTLLTTFTATDDVFVGEYNRTGTALDLAVLDNDDIDPTLLDGNSANGEVTIQLQGSPANLAVVGNLIQYTPGVTFEQTVEFDYALFDGTTTSVASVTLELFDRNSTTSPVVDDEFTVRRVDDLFGADGTAYEFLQNSDGRQVLDSRSELIINGQASGSKTGKGPILGEEVVIDATQSYTYSGWFRAGDEVNSSGSYSPSNTQYLGFREYDFDGNEIAPIHVLRFSGSVDAVLAEDFDPATDTQIVLVGTGLGWSTGGAGHTRNVAFLNYTTSDGITHADYTRHVTTAYSSGMWTTSGITEDVANNRTYINLSASASASLDVVPSGIITAGTKVRNASSGQTFNYSLGSAVTLIRDASNPVGWTYRTAVISGVKDPSDVGHTSFRPGTYSIRPAILANHTDSGGGSQVLEYRDVRFGLTQQAMMGLEDQVGFQAVIPFGGATLQSSDQSDEFLGDELVRVDAAKSYALTGFIRSGDGAGGQFNAANQHYIGVEQYDAQGRLLGRSGQTFVNTGDQWELLTLLFGGQTTTTSETTLKLRPDTAYVRPIVRANESTTGNLFSWRDLTVSRAVDLYRDGTVGLTFGGQTTYTTSTARDEIMSDQLLPVDTDLQYEIAVEMQAQQQSGAAAERHYFGFASYDIDLNLIKPIHVLTYGSSQEATLAVDFDPSAGGTMYLSGDLSGWSTGGAAHTRNLSFMSYADSTGHVHSDYSRYVTQNFSSGGMWASGGISSATYQVDGNGDLILDANGAPIEASSGSTVTLWKIAVNGSVSAAITDGTDGLLDGNGKIAAGTKVRNAQSGTTYNYALLHSEYINSEWTNYHTVIGGGTIAPGGAEPNLFRAGTAYIKLVGMFNWAYSGPDDDLTLTATEVSFRNASVAQLSHVDGVVTLDLDVLKNDGIGADPASVNITSVTTPEFGTVSVIHGNGTTTVDWLQYSTPAWFAGTDLFTYTATDGDGNEFTAEVRVQAVGHDVEVSVSSQGNPATNWETLRTQTDPAANTVAPTALDESYTVAMSGELTVNTAGTSLLNNDSVNDGDLAITRLVSGPANGALKLSHDGTFVYRPRPGFMGTDFFTYALFDGLHSSEATVAITVTNQAPILADTTVSLDENSELGTVVTTLVGTDSDVGDSLSHAITGGNTDNTFVIDEQTGVITLATPDPVLNFEATPTWDLQVQVTDSATNVDTATLTIALTDVNEAPDLTSPTTVSVAENSTNGTAVATLTASDPDANDTVTFSIKPGFGDDAFQIVGNQLQVKNAAFFNHEVNPTLMVTVIVKDAGELATEHELRVTVTDVNEAPEFSPLSEELVAYVGSLSQSVVGTVLATDPDRADSIAFSLVGGTGQGIFSIDAATGVIRIVDASVLDPEVMAQYDLQLRATETASGLYTETTVSIDVAEAIPVAQHDEVIVAAGGTVTVDPLANDSGWDGASITLSGFDEQTVLTLSHGKLAYQPKVSDPLLAEFEMAGGLDVWGTLRAYVNDRFADEDQLSVDWFAETIDWEVEDDDVFEASLGPIGKLDNGFDNYYRSEGSPLDRGKYVLYYVATDPLFTGSESVSYTVIDENGQGSAGTIAFTITADGLAGTTPLAVADQYALRPDQVLNVSLPDFGLLANDLYQPGSTTVTLVDAPLHGQVIVQSDGTFTYTPDSGYSGRDGFTYTVTNGSQISSAQTVLLDISDAHLAAPVAALTVEQGQTGSLNPLLDLYPSGMVDREVPDDSVEDRMGYEGQWRLVAVEAATQGTATVGVEVPEALVAYYESTGGDQRHGSLDGYIADHYGSLEDYIRDYGTINDRLRYVIEYENSTLADGQQETLVYVLENYRGERYFGEVTVTGTAFVNHAVIATDDTLEVDRDGFVKFDPRNNDTDVDGDSLVYTILGIQEPDPEADPLDVLTREGLHRDYDGSILTPNGKLSFESDGSLMYTPEAGFEGTETFDYEVTDGLTTATATVTITVRHGITTNNAPVLTDANFSIAEDAAAGTSVVPSNLATDADGDTLAYRILSGNKDNLFAIDAATGEITVASGAVLDFDTVPVHTLIVEVTDDGFPNVSTSATYTISLTDVNEAPAISTTTLIVDEDASMGTVIGTIVASDPDVGQSLTYAITGGNTNDAFAINAATGVIKVLNPSEIDYLTTPSFTLEVCVTDDGSGTLQATANVTILVAGAGANANQAPDLQNISVQLAENSVGGDVVVGGNRATDTDGNYLTYRIVSGNESGYFEIDPQTGEVTVKQDAPLDYETLADHTLVIEVTDDGLRPQSQTAEYTITLTDANDAPVFVITSLSMLDDAQQGDVVGAVQASDVDDGAVLTYSLLNDAGGLFAIDAATGVVTVATAAPGFDADVTGEYTLQVQVSDGTSSQTVDLPVEVRKQTKTDLTKTMEQLLTYGSFADDPFEAPVALPETGVIPEFVSADVPEYLSEMISEWNFSAAYPGQANVPQTITSYADSPADEIVDLPLGTLTISQVITGDRTVLGSYVDADNWTYTEVIDRSSVWTLAFDLNQDVDGEITFAGARSRTDKFGWRIEMDNGVFEYALYKLNDEEMRTDTFSFSLDGTVTFVDDDEWTTTLDFSDPNAMGSGPYETSGTQTMSLVADGSVDETGAVPHVTENYALNLEVSGDYGYAMLTSVAAPMVSGEEGTTIIVTDSSNGSAGWSFEGTLSLTGDGTDVLTSDESYKFSGNGDDTFAFLSTSDFNESETTTETVTAEPDEEGGTGTSEDFTVTSKLIGSMDISSDGTSAFDFELIGNRESGLTPDLVETVNFKIRSSSFGSYGVEGDTLTTLVGLGATSGEITSITITESIDDSGDFTSFFGTGEAGGYAISSSAINADGKRTGQAASNYVESGTSLSNYEVGADTEVWENATLDAVGSIQGGDRVYHSKEYFRTLTPESAPSSYEVSDTRSAAYTPAVSAEETLSFNTAFTSRGTAQTVSYYYEELSPTDMVETDENGAITSSTGHQTFYDYFSGTDNWNSTASSSGAITFDHSNEETVTSVATLYDDQSDGTFNYGTSLNQDSSSHQNGDELAGGGVGTATLFELDFFEGTVKLVEATDPHGGTSLPEDSELNEVATGPMKWSSHFGGTGTFTLTLSNADVDGDGVVEDGEQEAELEIYSRDDYSGMTGKADGLTEKNVYSSSTVRANSLETEITDGVTKRSRSSMSESESGLKEISEVYSGFVEYDVTDTLTTENGWDDDEQAEPTSTAVVNTTMDESYRFDEYFDYNASTKSTARYNESDENSQSRVRYSSGQSEGKGDGRRHYWETENLALDADGRITARSESNFTDEYVWGRGGYERLTSVEDEISDEILLTNQAGYPYKTGSFTTTRGSSTWSATTLFQETASSVSETIGEKVVPDDVVTVQSQGGGTPSEYKYDTKSAFSHWISDVGNQDVRTREFYTTEAFDLIDDGSTTTVTTPSTTTTTVGPVAQLPVIGHLQTRAVASSQGLGPIKYNALAMSYADAETTLTAAEVKASDGMTLNSWSDAWSTSDAGQNSGESYDHSESVQLLSNESKNESANRIDRKDWMFSSKQHQLEFRSAHAIVDTIAYGDNVVSSAEFSPEFPTFYDTDSFEDNYESEESRQATIVITGRGTSSTDQRESVSRSQGHSNTITGTGRNRTSEVVTLSGGDHIISAVLMYRTHVYARWDDYVEIRARNGRVDRKVLADDFHMVQIDSEFEWNVLGTVSNQLPLKSSGSRGRTQTAAYKSEIEISNYPGGKNSVKETLGQTVLDRISLQHQHENADAADGYDAMSYSEFATGGISVDAEGSYGDDGKIDYTVTGVAAAGAKRAVSPSEMMGMFDEEHFYEPPLSNPSIYEQEDIFYYDDSSNWTAPAEYHDGLAVPELTEQIEPSIQALELAIDNSHQPAGFDVSIRFPNAMLQKTNNAQKLGSTDDYEGFDIWDRSGPASRQHPQFSMEGDGFPGAANYYTPAWEFTQQMPTPAGDDSGTGDGTTGGESDGEADSCDCECPVEFQDLDEIWYLEYYDDNGTPDDDSDDILVGYGIFERYDVDGLGVAGAENLTLYDTDGNQVSAMGYDYRNAVIIPVDDGTEVGQAVPPAEKSDSVTKSDAYQISEVAGAIASFAGMVSGFSQMPVKMPNGESGGNPHFEVIDEKMWNNDGLRVIRKRTGKGAGGIIIYSLRNNQIVDAMFIPKNQIAKEGQEDEIIRNLETRNKAFRIIVNETSGDIKIGLDRTVYSAIFVAGILVPGPDDAILAAILSKHGLRIAGTALEKLIDGKWVKIADDELDDAVKTIKQDLECAKAPARVPTGQIHHPIATKVGRELNQHPTLRGHYQPRDRRLTTQAIDGAAHRGYQRWHRDLDDEVVNWLRRPENRNATPQQFEDWLRWRYNQPDLRERFPNGF